MNLKLACSSNSGLPISIVASPKSLTGAEHFFGLMSGSVLEGGDPWKVDLHLSSHTRLIGRRSTPPIDKPLAAFLAAGMVWLQAGLSG